MPNHVHMIVILQNEEVSIKSPPNALPLGDGFVRRGHIGPQQKGALGTFVNSFKSRVTRDTREQGFIDFGWQSRYNDRIIRDENEYNRIAEYINENVVKWDEDTNNKRNI